MQYSSIYSFPFSRLIVADLQIEHPRYVSSDSTSLLYPGFLGASEHLALSSGELILDCNSIYCAIKIIARIRALELYDHIFVALDLRVSCSSILLGNRSDTCVAIYNF